MSSYRFSDNHVHFYLFSFPAPYGCNIDADEMSCFEKIRNVTVLTDQAEEYDQSGEIDPVENMDGSSVFVWVHSYDCSAGSSEFELKKKLNIT